VANLATYDALMRTVLFPSRFHMHSSALLWLLAASLMHINASTPVDVHKANSTTRSSSMLDVVMLVLGVGGFALLFGYITLCERL
jgi:hypothetical protein